MPELAVVSPQSPVPTIDRELEQAVDRIAGGAGLPGDVGRIADLAAERVASAEPKIIAELEKLFGRKLVR